MGFWNILVHAQFVAIYRNSNRKRYSTAAYTARSEVARVQKCLTIARFLCNSLVLFRQLRYIEALSLVNGDSRRGRRAVHVYVRASAAAHARPGESAGTGPPNRGQAPKFSRTFDTHCAQLILRRK